MTTKEASSIINQSLQPPKQLLEEYTTFANELADIARKAIIPHWRTPNVQIEEKYEEGRSSCQIESPVTIADRNAEEYMRKRIEERYPTHGIYGEEFGPVRTDATWVWVLDPIDGTKSFITGKPLFGTLISCLYNGVPVIGIIDQCVLKERWVGCLDKQSTLNGKPITACALDSSSSKSKNTSLKSAILMATTPDMFGDGEEINKFNEVRSKCKHTNYGTDCYAYALLASGFGVHIVVEADLGLYDYCALVPVIEGAGGMITDWTGSKLTLQNHEESKGRVVACCNKALHNEAVQILNKKNTLISTTSPFPSSFSINTITAFAVGGIVGMWLSSRSRQ